MIDILFLCHRRPEFAASALTQLIAHTPRVLGKIHVWLDLAGHETKDTLAMIGAIAEWQSAESPIRLGYWGSPVVAFNQFLKETASEIVAKVDEDTVVPEGWLSYSLAALNVEKLDLLGIEPWTPELTALYDMHVEWPVRIRETMRLYQVVRHSHIGGIGLMRRSAFICHSCDYAKREVEGYNPNNCSHCKGVGYILPIPAQDGRYGFTEWQWSHPEIIKAFFNPPLPVFLLDHLPFEPWVSLSRKYEAEGIQRRVWGSYPESCKNLWKWRFPNEAK